MKPATKTKPKPVVNPNINCLMNMRCPKCGSFGPFRIAVNVRVVVTDDGYDLDADGIDDGWEPDSSCHCMACQWTGVHSNFYEENQIIAPAEWWDKHRLTTDIPHDLPVKSYKPLFGSNEDLFGDDYDPLFDIIDEAKYDV